ncbi:Malate/lactate/ureidoglycolate dehydrogenase, LDH2 family [Lihuaxuella thermophila]|uniref:Malate/lactate/ureidoglycolate dehydrogenase, LDH2 family n=1 Tax=Lihuaxuella thermophila TaxID=1173111 RepID=A0A1H8H5I9_9BACL|nr:Malate/lactate/ureidoglycolate dehydrogenase, LDH2 family [Lihuaxuella thermophila]
MRRLGVPELDAKVTADSLVQANLEGTDSHGISRLPIYARRLMDQRINKNPDIKIERSGSVIKVDGDNGLGQVVSYRSVQAAIPVAKETGIAGIAVHHSNHNGTAAYYCQHACREEMILIAMTNSPSGMIPHGGRQAYLGTNPIGFGFPVRSGPPVIVDMSSSVAARGKIILAAKEGREIPSGWAVDADGAVTTDPVAALQGGVLPFGGAKGFALATAIEILAGVLSGAGFGPHVQSIYHDRHGAADVGHFFILLNIAHWMPIEAYYDRLDQFIKELKAIPLAKHAEEICYPGERRFRRWQDRRKNGIPLSGDVCMELQKLAKICRVPFSLADEQGGDTRQGETH